MIEDQGAHVTAGALSGVGVRRHHLKGGSTVLHPMRGAHRREVARPQGMMAGRPMDLITVVVLGEGAEALWMMLMQRSLQIGIIGALLKKMVTVAALVLSVRMTEALWKMMITMVLQEAASRIKSSIKFQSESFFSFVWITCLEDF